MKYYSAQLNYSKNTSTLIYITQSPIILMAVETLKAISGANKKGRKEGQKDTGKQQSGWDVYLRSVKMKQRK